MYKVNFKDVAGDRMYSLSIENKTIPFDLKNMDFYEAIKEYKEDSSCFDLSDVDQETIDIINIFASSITKQTEG